MKFGLTGVAALLAVLATPPNAASQEAQGVAYTTAAMPARPILGSGHGAFGTAISNRSLARIFTTLTHDMEWGASRAHLVRYERPIRVGLEGSGISQYSEFLERFLSELRANTGIDIRRADRGQNLHIRFVSSEFTKLLPTVSCLVAPGDLSWRAFIRNPGRFGGRALVKARSIDDMTIFIPETAAPYLVRNCLLEEITQALGTANDLYGLGNSIFNDDAAHVWPTALDYLMLRVLYSPGMQTGLDREQTERRALQALDRFNPAGRRAPALLMPAQKRMATWRKRIQKVFSRQTQASEAMRLAQEALGLAIAKAPGSAYHCHSLITLGRVTARSQPDRALGIFDDAAAICTRSHGAADIRIARIGMERASVLLRLGRYAEIVPLTERILPILAAHGQDERLSALYSVQAVALSALGHQQQAVEARGLAAAWRAYALGIDRQIASNRG